MSLNSNSQARHPHSQKYNPSPSEGPGSNGGHDPPEVADPAEVADPEAEAVAVGLPPLVVDVLTDPVDESVSDPPDVVLPLSSVSPTDFGKSQATRHRLKLTTLNVTLMMLMSSPGWLGSVTVARTNFTDRGRYRRIGSRASQGRDTLGGLRVPPQTAQRPDHGAFADIGEFPLGELQLVLSQHAERGIMTTFADRSLGPRQQRRLEVEGGFVARGLRRRGDRDGCRSTW